jgi:hypothetical protein
LTINCKAKRGQFIQKGHIDFLICFSFLDVQCECKRIGRERLPGTEKSRRVERRELTLVGCGHTGEVVVHNVQVVETGSIKRERRRWKRRRKRKRSCIKINMNNTIPQRRLKVCI